MFIYNLWVKIFKAAGDDFKFLGQMRCILYLYMPLSCRLHRAPHCLRQKRDFSIVDIYAPAHTEKTILLWFADKNISFFYLVQIFSQVFEFLYPYGGSPAVRGKSNPLHLLTTLYTFPSCVCTLSAPAAASERAKRAGVTPRMAAGWRFASSRKRSVAVRRITPSRSPGRAAR